MATAVITGCKASKDQDTVVSVAVEYLVTGLTSTGTGILAEALATSGIPTYGDSFGSNANVICRGLDVAVDIGEDSKIARVTANYTTLGLEDGNYVFRCTSSLSEDVTTNDVNGNPVKLYYTYPADYADPSLAGVSVEQSPEMSVQLPQIVLTATGIDPVAKPVAVVADWVGRVNSDSWQGFPAGCWLCTAVPFEAHDLDASPPTYKFTFEFQLNRKGWTQYPHFRDVNGDIPTDLVYNFGKKRVVTQPPKAFGGKFPDA